ncbi:sensor domain-containing diguanylate cyclase [Pseudomonas kuykendallii]|nr:sensor domain-containing diguanylate cyclase [Pseudomonas kuykendallii]MCQ4273644.1 sensor domain-containing diguanylate cyclase [Pseudomonas kuykendallii]
MSTMPNARREMETDSAVYKTLLESTRAIPWKIDWKTMTFSYIGPQIETLLGWTQESWVGVDDWVARMHPEDRDYVVNFCVSQSQSGIDHEADYRALTADGGYVWIRDVVHVVRKDDEVEALVGFMFDISERKKAEDRLLQLQKELEVLSFQDGLTGLANRRLLDQTLDCEWASAQRSGLPLSVILLDIDYFKQYNDHYGHIGGDDCLRAVAQALTQAANRPRDFLARFGGEEFILLLPETDEVAARQIAERCRLLIRTCRIPHERSPISPLVTVSLGGGTVVPCSAELALDFIGRIDQLLYRAKQNGRDRAEFAEPPAGPADQA